MHKMNRFIAFLSFIILYVSPTVWSQEMPATAPEKVGLSTERLQRLSKVMQSYVDDDKLAGIVGLVARRGKIAYLKSFGMMDEDTKKPMADDAIFRIASMSKAITSVAVMMLYEEGRFLLDDPISDYIAAFKNPRLPAVYSPNDNGGIDKLSDEEVEMGPIVFSTSFHYKGPQTHFSGGAGLVSTARDYARFLQMLLNDGELDGVRLLSRKTVELITANHISHIDQGNFMFGLGFSIQAAPGKSGTIITEGSYGWGGFFNTRFWIDPTEELIGIFMSQRFPNRDIDAADKFQVLVYQAIVD